jgi:Uma2 family endonuclease
MSSSILIKTEQEVSLPVRDDPLYEVVDGQRFVLPLMSAYATWLASRLQGHLWPFAEAHLLGTCITEMLFILDAQRDLRRRPDVAFVSSQRWPMDRDLPATGDWEVVPDLAVEVISPHDVFKDILAKVRDYFHYGVQLVWVISPEEQQIYIYESPTQVQILSVGDELTGGNVVSGFQLPVASLFQRFAASHAASTS